MYVIVLESLQEANVKPFCETSHFKKSGHLRFHGQKYSEVDTVCVICLEKYLKLLLIRSKANSCIVFLIANVCLYVSVMSECLRGIIKREVL